MVPPKHHRGAPREEHLRIDILRRHLRQQADGIPATTRGVSRGDQRQRARIAVPIIEPEAAVEEHQRHHIATKERPMECSINLVEELESERRIIVAPMPCRRPPPRRRQAQGKEDKSSIQMRPDGGIETAPKGEPMLPKKTVAKML